MTTKRNFLEERRAQHGLRGSLRRSETSRHSTSKVDQNWEMSELATSAQSSPESPSHGSAPSHPDASSSFATSTRTSYFPSPPTPARRPSRTHATHDAPSIITGARTLPFRARPPLPSSRHHALAERHPRPLPKQASRPTRKTCSTRLRSRSASSLASSRSTCCRRRSTCSNTGCARSTSGIGSRCSRRAAGPTRRG